MATGIYIDGLNLYYGALRNTHTDGWTSNIFVICFYPKIKSAQLDTSQLLSTYATIRTHDLANPFTFEQFELLR